ncbi:hypothetical protein K474DRAFT_905477 [Panus rudis PR-1116 ss-1]|nr:hypothetical protein K474DRAFT_905477 [Panus rudis PR-1116 ss-1]
MERHSNNHLDMSLRTHVVTISVLTVNKEKEWVHAPRRTEADILLKDLACVIQYRRDAFYPIHFDDSSGTERTCFSMSKESNSIRRNSRRCAHRSTACLPPRPLLNVVLPTLSSEGDCVQSLAHSIGAPSAPIFKGVAFLHRRALVDGVSRCIG